MALKLSHLNETYSTLQGEKNSFTMQNSFGFTTRNVYETKIGYSVLPFNGCKREDQRVSHPYTVYSRSKSVQYTSIQIIPKSPVQQLCYVFVFAGSCYYIFYFAIRGYTIFRYYYVKHTIAMIGNHNYYTNYPKITI